LEEKASEELDENLEQGWKSQNPEMG